MLNWNDVDSWTIFFHTLKKYTLSTHTQRSILETIPKGKLSIDVVIFFFIVRAHLPFRFTRKNKNNHTGTYHVKLVSKIDYANEKTSHTYPWKWTHIYTRIKWTLVCNGQRSISTCDANSTSNKPILVYIDVACLFFFFFSVCCLFTQFLFKYVRPSPPLQTSFARLLHYCL